MWFRGNPFWNLSLPPLGGVAHPPRLTAGCSLPCSTTGRSVCWARPGRSARCPARGAPTSRSQLGNIWTSLTPCRATPSSAATPRADVSLPPRPWVTNHPPNPTLPCSATFFTDPLPFSLSPQMGTFWWSTWTSGKLGFLFIVTPVFLSFLRGDSWGNILKTSEGGGVNVNSQY